MTSYQCPTCRGRQPRVHILADDADYRNALKTIAARLEPPDDPDSTPWPDGDPEPMPQPRGKRRR